MKNGTTGFCIGDGSPAAEYDDLPVSDPAHKSQPSQYKKLVPVLRQCSDLVGQIKTLSRERKGLLDEKKATSVLNILEPPVQKRPVRHQPEPWEKQPKRDGER